MGLPKLTKERANQKLKDQGRDQSIECVSSPNGYRNKTLWSCNECGSMWESTPHTVLTQKHSCPSCNRVSNEGIEKALKKMNVAITCIEPVTYMKSQVKWQCNECEYQWRTTPNKILNAKTGCPKCSGKAKITNGDVDKKLKETDVPVERVGDVGGVHAPISWRCKQNKDHEWDATPASILYNETSCPYCYGEIGGHGTPTKVDGITFRSRIEAAAYTQLREFVERNSYTLEMQKRYNANTKHTCDFYIPEIKAWIEISNYTSPTYLKTIRDKKNGW